MTALQRELLEALRSTEGRSLVREIVSEALRAHAHETDETLLSVGEAARLVGRSPQALYKAAARRTMPGVVRQGGRILFRRRDLVTNGAR